MSANSTPLHCGDDVLRSNPKQVGPPLTPTTNAPSPAASPRVLVVEFRNHAFAMLKCRLEEHQCQVARAVVGSEVAAEVMRCAPDLILVNERMPDESGWLIACKLRLTQLSSPVWLYQAGMPRSLSDWKKFCGVNTVLAYDGVLRRLDAQIGEQLKGWLTSSEARPRRVERAPAVIA